MTRAWTELEIVSSRQNPIVKETFTLQKDKIAKKHQKVLLEGLRQLETALPKLDLAYLLFEDSDKGEFCFSALSSTLEGIILATAPEIRRVEANLFQSLAQTENSQGVIGVANAPNLADVSLIEPDSSGRYIFLENTNDPGNLGTIIRTCEGLGFSAIILFGDIVWPFNSKVMRASMGSVFHIPIYKADKLSEVQQIFQGLDIIVADMSGVSLSDYVPKQKNGFVIMLGNEARGVSEELIQSSDCVVAIEMQGEAESYNLGISAGILSWYLSKVYGFL